LTLSKIGSIRIFKHREVEGKIKTCTIKKDKLGHWYAILVTEIEDAPQKELKIAIGVDVGLKSLVALSTGETIQYPKYYIKTEQKLAVAQRDLSRKKKGSSNRQKAKIKVAKLHHKIQDHRDEFLHQVSRKLADSADLIVFENLNIQGMLKNHHLAKHIQDHAWGKLIQFTRSKAAKAGKVVELVDARYTSQKCSKCGIMVPKTLADRVHHCPNCGLEMDRDINASVNIVTLGLRGRALERRSTDSVKYPDCIGFFRLFSRKAGSPAPLGAGRKSLDSQALEKFRCFGSTRLDAESPQK
jgi:putative transposase